MEKKIDVSIIIVSYNTQKLTLKCLETLYKSLLHVSFTFEVIVIDNASIDETRQQIKTAFPKVRLLENKENVGFGKANNQGAENSKGTTILFLNSDIEVLDSAVEKLYRHFLSLPKRSVVGGKLLNPDGSPQSSCGPSYTLANVFIAQFLKGDHLHITRYSPDFPKEVDWVMGACMMMSKNVFQEMNGFDEGIFMYMEEIDLQKRIKDVGGKIFFLPQARFIHVGHASSEGRSNPVQNVFRGLIYYYDKHGSPLEKMVIRKMLFLKSLLAIVLFTILNKKYDRNIYVNALKIIK